MRKRKESMRSMTQAAEKRKMALNLKKAAVSQAEGNAGAYNTQI